jgi:DNA-binding transcriptional regulator GbsR (MarR family)
MAGLGHGPSASHPIVGQIYALLYVSPEPLCADQIVEALGISRSNISMSLRELQAWNLVLLKHRPGDRRDFFTAPDDVWQILRTLAEERKKREIDPTLSVPIFMALVGCPHERASRFIACGAAPRAQQTSHPALRTSSTNVSI